MGKYLFGVVTKYPFLATRLISSANRICRSQPPTCSITALEKTQSNDFDRKGKQHPSPRTISGLKSALNLANWGGTTTFTIVTLLNDAYRRRNSPVKPAPPPTSSSES